jgi:phosphotransferase system enzyme I (PtsP)
MQNRGGDSPRITPSEPALRIILRRLREIMAEPSDGQSRLDRIVRQIAGLMVAEVCSIYLKRQDGSLELSPPRASPGRGAQHFIKRRGLVGVAPSWPCPINEPDAQNHSFYRPEMGEEVITSVPGRADPARRRRARRSRCRTSAQGVPDEDVEVL